MKKIFSILSLGLVLGAVVSCVQEKVYFDPAEATAPVIESYSFEEDVLTAAITPAVFNQSYNNKIPVNHSFVIKTAGGKSVNQQISTEEKDNVLTTKTSTISRMLARYGFADGDIVDISLVVRGYMKRVVDNGTGNGGVESASQIDLAGFEVKVGSPYASYTKDSEWSVIGALSEYGINWDKDLNMWTDGANNHVAAHVSLKADDEFKFRKGLDWAENFGGEFASTGTVFSVEGNGANIKVGADGVYDIFFNDKERTAWIQEAFDPYPDYVKESNWSVIGKLTKYEIEWNGDLPMVSDEDGNKHVALSVELGDEDEFKFRKDKDWTVNMGGEFGGMDVAFPVKQDGSNIKVGAEGVYDLFVNLSDNTAMVAEASGLKVSGIVVVSEADDKPKAWSLVGTLEDSNWGKDYDLTNVTGDVWTINNVLVRENDEFKIRADHKWDISYGGPEENAQSTYKEGDVYGVYQPTLGETFDAGEKNIRIGAEGHYNITLTYGDEPTILIEEYKEFPEHVYMTGADFGNWSWGEGTVELTPVLHNPSWGANAEAQFWTVRYLTAGNGVKFNSALAWDGKQFGSLETNEGFTNDGDGNVQVAESGLYMIHIDFKRSILHLEPARIYAIGATVADGSWVEGLEAGLFTNNGPKTSFTTQNGGELRMYAASEISTSDAWTREFIILEGKIEYRGNGGDQERVQVLAEQVITLDFNAGTGSIAGEGVTPEPPSTDFADYIYAIGADTDWSGVYPLRSGVESGANNGVYKGFGYLSGEFKFKPNEGDWTGDWECTGEGQIGQGTDNCPAPATAGYYMIVVNLNEMTYELTPITTIGIVGPAQAGGWDADTDMTFNQEGGYWEASNVALSAGDMKFRANDAWDINWGGALDALVQGGGNIAVEAGTYDIRLYALCDGKASATLTAK